MTVGGSGNSAGALAFCAKFEMSALLACFHTGDQL